MLFMQSGTTVAQQTIGALLKCETMLMLRMKKNTAKHDQIHVCQCKLMPVTAEVYGKTPTHSTSEDGYNWLLLQKWYTYGWNEKERRIIALIVISHI